MSSYHDIPSEMKMLRQWVAANESKEPFNPHNLRRASVTDPNSWGTFEEACSCGLPHIGFVFTREDPYVFIDLDTGKKPDMRDLHVEIILEADSYTETSISGNSSHIVVKGNLPNGMRADKQGIEIYPADRFMLMTGWTYHQSVIKPAQALLDYLAEQIGNAQFNPTELTTLESTYTDEQLYATASQAENGDKFVALFNGGWENYQEYMGDHSRADLGLCTFLDFYTKDVEQAVRLFKRSTLYRPEKGRTNSDGTDYILRTLKSARARNEADQPPPVDAAELMRRVQHAMAPEKPFADADADIPMESDDAEQSSAEAGKKPNKRMTLPPGLVGQIAQYIHDSAIRPVPEVALMGALAFVAGVVGRQYNIPGSGLNLYLILLAPTGTGKEGAASGIQNLVSHIRQTVPSVDQFTGPAEFASGPALIKTLDRQPCFYSMLGEFGIRMQQMADPRANGAERTLQKALLNLYSKSGWHQSESSSAYSDKEKNTSTLYAPSLTIFGESTPESFFAGLDENHVTSGLLPRFSVLEYNGDRPPMNEISAFCAPDPGLVQNCADLVASAIQLQANATCQPVAMDSEAVEMLREFNIYADGKINAGTEVYKQLWNRAHLKACRMAGVLAVGVNNVNPTITKVEAEWAIQFTKQDIGTIENRFLSETIGAGEHTYEAEIRTAVKAYLKMDAKKREAYRVPKSIIDENIIPFGYLRRRLRVISGIKNDRRGISRAIKEAVNDMVEAGILQQIPPLVRKEKYGCQSELFIIGESW